MTDYAKKVLITIGIILAIISIPIIIIYILPHFAPFIFAYLFALILEPINKYIIKYGKVKRVVSVNITYFLFVGILSLLTYVLFAKITAEMLGLIKYIEKNIPNIQTWILDIYSRIQDYIQIFPEEVKTKINDSFNDLITKLTSIDLLSTIGTRTYNLTTAIPNYFIISIIFFVSLYLISLSLPKIHDKFYSYFKESSQSKLTLVLKGLQHATVGFLQAQLILSTITYLISLVGLAILGVKYSYAIAVIIVIVDMLPILGTGSVLVPWATYAFTKGDTFLGIGLIVLFLLIVIIRRIIEPKILGERIGLTPLVTLISIWVGFKVLGILGVFLGPLLLILYKLLVKAEVIKYKLKI